ncbi:MAG: hypothetical protein GY825_06825, partial [Phycisphaeraceae bacterium]|nr:hypothetical protein [Phycisphaeraceae bacterium]
MARALEDRIHRDARFASDVSHELRSPLTTLMAGVGVLDARRDELSERSRTALDLLVQDLERFNRLVNELMEISGYDAGVADLDLSEVDVVRFLQATVAADPALVADMDRVRDVCSAALALRAAENARVRQPLAGLVVAGADNEKIRPYLDLIADEVNVKRVELGDEIDAYATFGLKVNAKALGPRLG